MSNTQESKDAKKWQAVLDGDIYIEVDLDRAEFYVAAFGKDGEYFRSTDKLNAYLDTLMEEEK